MLYGWRRFRDPLFFQGRRRASRYFEGWYFKQVSADGGAVHALIPGVAMSPSGSKSFVQFIDGTTGATRWFPFPADAFSFSRDRFEVRVADNVFSREGVRAALRGPEGTIEAQLDYGPPTPLPFSLGQPGIMGPYAYAPFMECSHAVGSMDHDVGGTVTVDGRRADFRGGRGYIEKDWGRSFPRSWIWAQSNGFGRAGTSFVFSLARVPWMGRWFPGFFALLLEGGRFHRFASYTGAEVRSAVLAGRELAVEVRGRVDGRPRELTLRAVRSHEGVLLAPVEGAMDRRIGESIDARLSVRLADGDGRTLFEGEGRSAGLEVVGDVASLGVSVRDPSPGPRA